MQPTTCNILCRIFWYLPPYFSVNVCINIAICLHMAHHHSNSILLYLKSIKPSAHWLSPSVSHFQNPEGRIWSQVMFFHQVTYHWPAHGWAPLNWIPTLNCCQGWNKMGGCSRLALISWRLIMADITNWSTWLNYNSLPASLIAWGWKPRDIFSRSPYSLDRNLLFPWSWNLVSIKQMYFNEIGKLKVNILRWRLYFYHFRYLYWQILVFLSQL